MGSAEFANEQPLHTVYLDAFWIDRTEISNAKYRKCVESGPCRAPAACDWGTTTYKDASGDDYPVACVSWSQARTYCEWAGARLPTEAEWEKAARGTDERTYPWGNSDPDCSRTQSADCDGQTAPVGSKALGASPSGALDMAGNVWEWVSDWYDEDYYASAPTRNPQGPSAGTSRVLRGGSWYTYSSSLRAAHRTSATEDSATPTVGFRCAYSATE